MTVLKSQCQWTATCLVVLAVYGIGLPFVLGPQPDEVDDLLGPEPVVVQPQSEVRWSIEITHGFERAVVMQGEGTVCSQGNIRLGPYGNVKVSGLTTVQAEIAMEKHLTDKWTATWNPIATLRVKKAWPPSR